MNRKKSPVETGLNYFDHLEILRWKIISVLIVILAGFIVSLIFIDKIVLFLQNPIRTLNLQLNYFKPYEKFLAYMKVALFTGITISIPFAIYQAASFINPALKKEEKWAFYPVVFLIPVIFIAGAYFAYSVIAPIALRFFVNFASGDNVIPLWSIGEYFDLLTAFLLACGLIFQAPLVLLFLIKIKVLSVKTLVRLRSYIIVAIAIIAGALSPPDVVSQILLGVPLYLLFELTIIIGRFIK